MIFGGEKDSCGEELKCEAIWMEEEALWVRIWTSKSWKSIWVFSLLSESEFWIKFGVVGFCIFSNFTLLSSLKISSLIPISCGDIFELEVGSLKL